MQVSHLLTLISVTVALGICKPAAAAPQDMPAQVESATVATSAKLAPAAAPDAASMFDGFSWGGYSSAGFNIHPGGKTDATLNEVSLIMRWEGDSRFRFFSELELENPISLNRDERFTKKPLKLDLERLYGDYNLSEKVNLRAGRFLTPAGIWNLEHAHPLVWTTTRPLATSRLFPLSTDGAMLYGATPLNNKAFEYSVFVEALQDRDLDRNEIQFRNTRGARFLFSGKVNLGISLLEFSEIVPMSEHFRMLGLDFSTQHNGWELRGEAFQRFYNNGNAGGNGAYLQGVAPIGNHGAGNGWFAVARIEDFKRPAEGSSERWVLGTAWRMAPNRVLKMEYVGGGAERTDSPKGFLASFAILF